MHAHTISTFHTPYKGKLYLQLRELHQTNAVLGDSSQQLQGSWKHSHEFKSHDTEFASLSLDPSRRHTFSVKEIRPKCNIIHCIH